jgi:hypothetical protein
MEAPARFLPIYHIETRRLAFAPLPVPPAQASMSIWLGLAPSTGPYVYLFPEKPPAIIRWDTRSDTGTLIAYPFPGPEPAFGMLSADETTAWCPIWNGNTLARFDLGQARWTGSWRTPVAGGQPTYAGMHGRLAFLPELHTSRLLIFDTAAERWVESLPVPGHGRDYGTLGAGLVYRGMMYCAMTTLKSYIPDGGPLGIDGRPHHFVDRNLCYDSRTRRFGHLVLPGSAREYWLTYYSEVAGQHLYLTAFNARQSDGRILQEGQGDAVIFQTHPPGQPDANPVFEPTPALS